MNLALNQFESVWTIDGKVRYKRVGSKRMNTSNCHDDVMKVTARPRGPLHEKMSTWVEFNTG